MKSYGVRFQPSLGGTLHLGRTNAFFLGGGKALMNSYYAAAQKRGIRVLYNAEVTELDLRDGKFECGSMLLDGQPAEFRAKALVVASGGFESNLEWLEEAWGPAARNFIIRGTPYNKGKLLKLLHGPGRRHGWRSHAMPLRSPSMAARRSSTAGIVTRLDCVPLGIVVNKQAERFYDEGEDLWPKRYAIWGRLVAQQTDQIAYSIIDSKVIGRFMPSVFPAIAAATHRRTRREARSCRRRQARNHRAGSSTRRCGREHSITRSSTTAARRASVQPKSHWAQAIDRPPFYGYPLRPGITFTYLGVRVNERAEVQGLGSSTNIFAAGEIMAGNVVGKGYLAGLGMTIGSVFGRIAGKEAARAAAA